MMGILFTPWRYTYIASGGKGPCIFCGALKAQNPKEKLLLRAEKRVITMLNRFPYTNGHIMVAPQAHKGNLEDLTKEEMLEMMEEVQRWVAILRKVYQCHGFNVGINLGRAAGAGIEDHLHVHIVPRWNGDHNFMRVLSDVRLIPETLEQTYEKLRKAYQEYSC